MERRVRQWRPRSIISIFIIVCTGWLLVMTADEMSAMDENTNDVMEVLDRTMTSMNEELVYLVGEVLLSEDFEGSVPAAFMPDSIHYTIEDFNGGSVLSINGQGAVRMTGMLIADEPDYVVEVDVMQQLNAASTNGGFSIAARVGNDNKQYRLRYIDVMKFNPITRKFDNTAANVRDRISIARADGEFSTWYYGTMSDIELGILNKANRSFDNTFYRLTFLVAGDQLSGKMSDLEIPFVAHVKVIDPDTHVFSSVELQLEQPGLYLQQSTTFQVFGWDGEFRVQLEDDQYTLEYDNQSLMVDASTHQVTGLQSGDHTMKIIRDGLTDIVIVHVSDLYSMRLELTPEVVEWGETTEYRLWGMTSGGEIELSPLSYTLEYDTEKLTVDTGARKVGGSLGTHVLAAVRGWSREEAYLTVKDINSGYVLSEDFESGEVHHDYMRVPSEAITLDNGNGVYRLHDEMSPIFGLETWNDYTVSGKVKIVQSHLDPNRFNSTFEIVPRWKAKREDVSGGQGGIPFVYRMNEPNEPSYMRIGASPGAYVSIEDGNWHDFQIHVARNQMIFELSGTTQYYSFGLPATFGTGGFSFRAENSEVYLDDLVLTKHQRRAHVAQDVTALSFDAPDVVAVKYDIVTVPQLSALRASYNDGGGGYITELANLNWSIETGQHLAEIMNGNTIRFLPQAQHGDEIVVRVDYAGHTARLNVTVDVPTMSELDYIRSRVPIRQYDLLMTFQHRYETGRVLQVEAGAINFLQNIFGKMMLHPQEDNYDRELNWMVDQTDYEENVRGRSTGGSDFIITQMVSTRWLLDDQLNVSSAVWDKMKQYLQNYHYAEPTEIMSENHMLHHLVSGMLIAEIDPAATMWNGLTGLQNQSIYKQHILDWIQYRLGRGMGEYDSIAYYGIDIAALSQLYTFVQDEELQQAAYAMLQYVYADMAVDSVEGMMGGAHGRSYAKQLTLFNGLTNYAADLLFGNATRKINETYGNIDVQGAPVSVSRYRPSSLLMQIVRDPDKRFNNLERKHIYHMPVDPTIGESLKKYTHITPNYVLGAVVQQDLPDDLVQLGDKLYKNSGIHPAPGTWVAPSHQDWSWSLTFAGSREAVIFSHHPGNVGESDTSAKHNYWSGDYTCLCYEHHQEDNVLMGLYQIPLVSQNVSQAQFIHFWFPRDKFEQVDEEEGWIFVRHRDAYAALKPMKDGSVSNIPTYEWTMTGAYADVEMKVNSPHVAFVVETADSAEYLGSFEQFKAAIKQRPITYDVDSPYVLEYTGLNGKKLRLEYDSGKRWVDHIEIDYNSYPLHDSPYMTADWADGEFTLHYGGESETWSIVGLLEDE